MKTKFQNNVAVEMPKTKAREPELPWKLKNEDIEGIDRRDEYIASLSKGTPPFKTRAIFLILLVLTIFTAVFYLITNIVIENENIRTNILKKELETSSLQTKLEKMTEEKKAMSETSAQLERKVSDLNAQKQLFTSVIETLTKKGDEPEPAKSDEQLQGKKAPENTPAASASLNESAPSVQR